jgi:GNAT superfamily N-acetyltransferase
MSQLFSSTDLALARRIEAGHAHSATASNPAASIETIGGGWAIFHQVDSPMTQTIGLGLNGPVAPADLDRLETFFHSRGSAAIIDLCTLAAADLLALLEERRYTIREIGNVLVRRLDPAEEFPDNAPGITVEAVPASEFPAWIRLVVQGFAGQDEVPEEQLAMMAAGNPLPEAFFGWLYSTPGAGAAMDVQAGLATFFGDATLVRARGRGLQHALIHHRLLRAAQLGCDLATATVVPGSISHRNYERAGFQLVYGRVMLSSAKSNR